MNLKPDLSTGINKARIASDNTVLKCGECLHFKGSAHPSIGTPCSQRGVKPYGIAPNCYTPDVHQLKSVSIESFQALSTFVSTCKPSQAKILMGMLKNQAQLKRFELSFLEKVYFAVGTGEYLSSYFAGFALGVAPQNGILIVGLQYFSNTRSPVVATMDRRSVLTREEFEPIAKRLNKLGKLRPPRDRRPLHIPPDIAKYEPPTIETSQELLDSVASPATKKKKVVKRDVLYIGGQTEEV